MVHAHFKIRKKSAISLYTNACVGHMHGKVFIFNKSQETLKMNLYYKNNLKKKI